MKNPFKTNLRSEDDNEDGKRIEDPLSVEDLLVDGTVKATVTSDGRLISKNDALKDGEEHIDLLKQREWGKK